MPTYIIVAAPKPGAPAGAWLSEWSAIGPFESYHKAEAARVALPVSPSFHTRVVQLRAGSNLAARFAEMRDAGCPCWTDPELARRGLYCPTCTAEIAGEEPPDFGADSPCSAAGGSWRV